MVDLIISSLEVDFGKPVAFVPSIVNVLSHSMKCKVLLWIIRYNLSLTFDPQNTFDTSLNFEPLAVSW